MKVTFVPDEVAGTAISALFGALRGLNTTRARRVNHNRVAQALRLLGVIANEQVTFVAEGINSAGRTGLFIGQEGEGSIGFGGTQDAQTRS